MASAYGEADAQSLIQAADGADHTLRPFKKKNLQGFRDYEIRIVAWHAYHVYCDTSAGFGPALTHLH